MTSRYQDEVSPGVRRTMENVQRAVVQFGSVIAGMTIANQVKKWMSSFVESGAELERMSRRTGQTVEDLSALKYAAYQNDLEFETMVKSLGFLSRSMNAAQRDSSAQAKIFKELGVETRDLSGRLREPMEVFLSIGERLSTVSDNAKAAAYSMILFGRNGQELLPVLRNIGELERSMAEARSLGLVTTAEEAAEAAKAEEALKSYETAMQSLKRTIGGIAVSMATPFVEMFRDLVVSLKAFVKETPNVTAGLGAIIGAGAGMAGLAATFSLAANAVVQFRSVLALLSVSMGSFLTVAGPVTVALAAVAYFYHQIQKEKAAAEAELARNPWREQAEGAAEAYQATKALWGQYEELAKKVRRTREEEERLLEVRRQMNANPAFEWDVSGGKVNYGKFREVVDRNRDEVKEQLAQLEWAITENQRRLSTATGAARAAFAKNVRELQAAAEPLREALGLVKGEDEGAEARAKKAATEREALAKMVLQVERERMGESEALYSEFLERVREVDKLETVSARDKAEAKWKILLAYYEKATKLTEGWYEEVRKSEEAMADSVREMTEKNIQEAQRGADAFGEAMLEKVRKLNDARDAQVRASMEAAQLQGEREILQVELDATMSEDGKSAMIAYIEYMTEIKQLQIEIGEASATAERENIYDRMANAALRYQRSLQGLRKEQGVLKTTTNVLTQAFQASFQAAVLGQDSFGNAMRKMVADYIASQASLAMVGAIVEMAHGFAALASHRYADAAFHFKAAAFYAAVGAVAGMAARAIAGGGAGGGSGAGGEKGEETGPREYSTEDLRRIRSQSGGESGSAGGGEYTLGKSSPVVNVTFKVQAIDAAGVSKLFQRQGGALARSVADALVRNGSTAKRLGGLATREL